VFNYITDEQGEVFTEFEKNFESVDFFLTAWYNEINDRRRRTGCLERRMIPLRELPLKNDFMFGQVMRNADICKLFLEELLGQKIDRIEYIENQKELSDSYEHHGIRLDVYLHDGAGTVYAIEMQTIRKCALEKRVRFYQGSIDRNELLKGHSYSKLSESFVIFICDFDYFGTGLAVNERVSFIKDTQAAYEDGSHVIFLNSRYKTANAGPAITEFLDYIRTNDDSGNYTTELVHRTMGKVQEVRSNDKMEVSYMMWELKYQDAVEEGREEGRAEGKAEGTAERALSDLKNLMETTRWSIEQTLAALKIPKEEWDKYTRLLSEQ